MSDPDGDWKKGPNTRHDNTDPDDERAAYKTAGRGGNDGDSLNELMRRTAGLMSAHKTAIAEMVEVSVCVCVCVCVGEVKMNNNNNKQILMMNS